jgi:hypothetical protein
VSAGFQDADAQLEAGNLAGQSDPGGTAADNTDIELQEVIRHLPANID